MGQQQLRPARQWQHDTQLLSSEGEAVRQKGDCHRSWMQAKLPQIIDQNLTEMQLQALKIAHYGYGCLSPNNITTIVMGCRELACDLREESKHRSKDGASIENCWKGKQWRRRLVTISAVTWRRTSCSKASRAVQATHCTFTCNACRSQISCGK